MNKYTILLFVLLSSKVYSQQVDWVISNPVDFSLNPGLTTQSLETSANGNIICSRLDTIHLVFNNNVYGRTTIECLDPTGHILWTYILTDSVVVTRILTDANNRIYIGGRFMGTAILNGSDTMYNSSADVFSENEFILKLSSAGSLLWKSNLGLTIPGQNLTAFACDQQNMFWFCTSDFMDGRLFKTNNFGDVIDSIVIENSKQLSGVSFDSFGALYICGSAELGLLQIGSSQFTVTDPYMMYIAKLDTSVVVDWIYFAHDITFQSPQLVSDGTGGVFFAGNFFDSLSWGSISFPHPQWNNDFFLVRIDSIGNFRWGRSFPVTPTINGRFSIGSRGKFIDTDPAGNVLLLGTLNGSVNWGSGVAQSGTQGSEKLHVVSFERNNVPQWQKTGGGQGNYPTDISVSAQNEVYFTSAVTDTCTFDSITVNIGNHLATVVVKILPATVGIKEFEKNGVAIYPNPADASIVLPIEWADKLIYIYGLDGRLIKSFKAYESELSTVELTNGNYIIRCEGQYSHFTILRK